MKCIFLILISLPVFAKQLVCSLDADRLVAQIEAERITQIEIFKRYQAESEIVYSLEAGTRAGFYPTQCAPNTSGLAYGFWQVDADCILEGKDHYLDFWFQLKAETLKGILSILLIEGDKTEHRFWTLEDCEMI